MKLAAPAAWDGQQLGIVMLVAVGWKIAECIAAKWKPDSIMAAPILTSMQAQTRGWKGLKSIGQAITSTTAKDGTETSEVRYYINRIQPKVKLFAESVRSHWSIESMHWILDVVFKEDKSRLRNDRSPGVAAGTGSVSRCNLPNMYVA